LKYRAYLTLIAVLIGSLCLRSAWPGAERQDATRKMAHDIFKQLIEINTADSIGSTTVAAQAMAQRLLDAGFPAADVTVMGPNERKGNLIARYRGKAGKTLRPILIIGHLDVVEARPEDWTTDPFQFVEKDGYYYGRGTQDMKASDAIMVTDFIRLKQERFVPDRDIILTLTADEEGGTSNGVDWLLKNHRDLIDAEYVLNTEATGVVTDHGKPLTVEVVATEKLYGDYQVLATNPGGHSSLPKPDNAIYHVADALAALEKTPFLFELNSVTREYFAQMAATLSGPTAADMRAMLATPPDAAAIARLSQDARYNATLRTTCVATMMSAGHAPNALPQRAEANVNCRIFPGAAIEEVRQTLARILADPEIAVTTIEPSDPVVPPPPLTAAIMKPIEQVTRRIYPGIEVVPVLQAAGTDAIYLAESGIPTYGLSGMFVDPDLGNIHGLNERIRVQSLYDGRDFLFMLVKIYAEQVR